MIGFPSLDKAPQLDVIGADGRREFDHRFIADRCAFLRQKPKLHISLKHDLARVGGLFTEDERKERRLAGAIRADQTNAILAIDLKGHIVEQHTVTVALADARKR